MSAAPLEHLFGWHNRGEALEVDTITGGRARLLLTVADGDHGGTARIDLPESEVARLARVLVEHVRENGLTTGDAYVDVYGLEGVFDEDDDE